MSEVKVNKISPRTNCGTVTLGDSGDSFAIATCASFKTKDVKDTSGNIIISRCGSNITIGSSGAAVALAAGATQSGFGRTGTVNWDTTPKTTTVTAASGVGYFVDTTLGAVTVNLPAGTAGDIVAISDYANTAATNNITIDPNGTDKINGTNADAKITTNGVAVTLIYVDSTIGWKDVNDATLDVTGLPPFVAATGGTILTCGDYKTHVFTGPGTFTVTNAGSPAGSDTVEYLVVGGGGGSGTGVAASAGGGGAGGFRSYSIIPCGSPLNAPAALPVSVQGYPITIGAGGGPESKLGPLAPAVGTSSIFSTITSAAGGAGRPGYTPLSPGAGYNPVPQMNGGSGGGATGNCAPGIGGSGNTPPTSPSQGNAGGNGNLTASNRSGGGGGGAGAAGQNGVNPNTGGAGGIGSYVADSFFGPTAPSYGTPGPAPGVRYFAGGGGGLWQTGGTPGAGGAGGGGAGGSPLGVAGTVNTGGGAGAGSDDCIGSRAGGSGIVVIRYKFQ